MPSRVLSLGVVALTLLSLGTALAAPPEIAKVHPDYQIGAPGGHLVPTYQGLRIIVGDNFDEEGLEVWCWQPPRSEEIWKQAIADLGRVAIVPPATPPEGAVQLTRWDGASPLYAEFNTGILQPNLIMDVEKQVITVLEPQGAVLWVKNRDGWSQPYVYDIARPFWISRQQAAPGAALYMYGFGLQRELTWENRAPRAAIVLENGAHKYQATVQNLAPRNGDFVDNHLVHWFVPADAAPGTYTVWVNNQLKADRYGWARAGTLEIVPPAPRPAVFSVKQYGAQGDGVTNDFAALTQAMAAAAAAGGGVVYLPPGTYVIDETLRVPEGVTLAGSSRENTVLLGVGFAEGREAQGQPVDLALGPAALVSLASHTGLEGLTLDGAVSRGFRKNTWGGHPMVRLDQHVEAEPSFDSDDPPRQVPPLTDISIIDCRLNAGCETPRSRAEQYRTCVWGWHVDHVTLNNNEFVGTVNVQWGNRVDLIQNTFREAYQDKCAVILKLTDSLVDSNQFKDDSSRFVMYPSRRTYCRLNRTELHARGIWNGDTEGYCIHAWDHRAQLCRADAGTETTVTSRGEKWAPGALQGRTVLIISGRGFGQYREVVSNTADTLTVDSPWRLVPDETSVYVVSWMTTNIAWFGNVWDGPLSEGMTLWYNLVDNLVDRFYNVSGAGRLNLWNLNAVRLSENGALVHPRQRAESMFGFQPSWYNLISRSDLGGGVLFTNERARDSFFWETPGIFGTVLYNNRFSDDFVFGMHGSQTPAVSHTLMALNRLGKGLQIRDVCRKTWVLKNTIGGPLGDRGALTVCNTNAGDESVADRVGTTDFTPPPALARRQMIFRVPEFEAGVTAVRAEPGFALRVNCGGVWSRYVDRQGHEWQPDLPPVERDGRGMYWPRSAAEDLDAYVLARADPDLVAPGVYASLRTGLTYYKLAVPAGKYTVRLHFMEVANYIKNPGGRVFQVGFNGGEARTEIDAVREAGGLRKPLMKELKGVEAPGGVLRVDFYPPERNETMISGIEVLAE